MLNLNDMLIFSQVANTGGISSAAEQLEMPKSRVSRRMAALETELGIRLLERNTRSVRLTEAGGIFLQHCQRVAEEASSAIESINHLTETPRGHLRVSASVTIGQHLLARHIPEFTDRYPQVDVELQLNNRRVDLIAEGFDVAIRVGALDDSTLVSRLLGHGHAQLYASPIYLEKHGSPVRVSSLKNHALLCRTPSDKHNKITLIGPGNRQADTEFTSVVKTNDLTTLRQIACNGGGIALLPGYLADACTSENTLIEVLPNWHTESFNVYALYPSHRSITLKVRVWIDFLRSKLREPQ